MRLLAPFPLVVIVLLCGCKANPPGNVETKTVTWVKHHLSVGNKGEKNPLPNTAQSVEDGKEAFQHYCAACHGRDGQNTGVPFANRMAPPIPSLASDAVQQYTDGQLKWILDYGLWPSGMPASKGTLSEDELWSIVIYIRHLPQPGSLGEPEMYTH